MRYVGLGLAVAVSLIRTFSPAYAQSASYSFKLFQTLPNVSNTLVAMNAVGAKLFQRQAAGGAATCLLVSGSKRIVIRDAKGVSTWCAGLGSDGGVVGYYVNGSGETSTYTGFAFLNGAYADIVPPGTDAVYGSMATAVSPNGLIAGMYLAGDYSYPSFLTFGSTYNVIPNPIEVGVFQPTGVTDNGIFIGIDCALTLWGNECLSFLIENGSFAGISFPGSLATFAHGIDNKGDVVGYYENADYVRHGFIFSTSKNLYFGPIDVSGSTGTELTGITENDVVVGSAEMPGSSVSTAILGTPTKSAP